MAGPSGTIRRYYRRLSRGLANTCHAMVVGGMGVVLTWVALDRFGLAPPDVVPLVALGVAFLGGVLALCGTVALSLKQNAEARSLSATQELARYPAAKGFVVSEGKALVCFGGVTLEFDGLEQAERRRLADALASDARASKTHVFEAGPPARAKLWWMSFAGCAVQVSLVLGAVGYTIDHLMPLAVYTSLFVASAVALIFTSDRSVTIGIDGVRMGRDFVPYADLQQLTLSRGRLSLVRGDGERIQGTLKVDATLAKALDALVQERVGAKVRDGEAYERQSDESFADYLKRVRGRFDATSFREAPASVDSAKELLGDAKVPFRVRVAVAVALSAVDSDYVSETLSGLAHPAGESLLQALALAPEAQDSRLEKLVS